TCFANSDCGVDTACQQHLCTSGSCSVVNTAAGTVVSNPTLGDCRANKCDGNGGVTVNVVDNTDVPADDGNPCTGETCVAGAPQHPVRPLGTACNQGVGIFCDGGGACVECITNADCGISTPCQQHVCSAGVCGVNNIAAGVVVGDSTPGD